MAVTRMLDRIRDGIEKTLSERCPPDDKVEFDVGLTVVQVHDEENDCCKSITAVSIYGSLEMPEHGPQARFTEHNVVAARYMEDEDEVEAAATDLWEGLQAGRMMAMLDREIEAEVHGEDPSTG